MYLQLILISHLFLYFNYIIFFYIVIILFSFFVMYLQLILISHLFLYCNYIIFFFCNSNYPAPTPTYSSFLNMTLKTRYI